MLQIILLVLYSYWRYSFCFVCSIGNYGALFHASELYHGPEVAVSRHVRFRNFSDLRNTIDFTIYNFYEKMSVRVPNLI